MDVTFRNSSPVEAKERDKAITPNRQTLLFILGVMTQPEPQKKLVDELIN